MANLPRPSGLVTPLSPLLSRPLVLRLTQAAGPLSLTKGLRLDQRKSSLP